MSKIRKITVYAILASMILIISAGFALAGDFPWGGGDTLEYCGKAIDCTSTGGCQSETDPAARLCASGDPDCGSFTYFDTFSSIEFCGSTLECIPHATDGICPEDYEPDSRTCEPCDLDCDPDCEVAFACVLDDATVSLDFDQNSDNIANIGDTILIEGEYSDPACEFAQHFVVKVENFEDEDNPCREDIHVEYSDGIDYDGSTIWGNFKIEDIASACENKEVKASGEDDAAYLRYGDNYAYSKASGSFTFGADEGEEEDEPTPEQCEDGIDNDGDGKIDYPDDEDCRSTLNGFVRDSETGQGIPGASVNVRSSKNYITETDNSGWYSIDIDPRHSYLFTISKHQYAPKVVDTDAQYEYGEVKTTNVEMVEGLSNCEADCTRTDSNMCDRTCEGWNGCSFQSTLVMNICDPTDALYDGATTTHHRKFKDPIYGDSIVRCCGDDPEDIYLDLPRDKVQISVSENNKNIITTSRIVVLNGVPVKMNVVVVD